MPQTQTTDEQPASSHSHSDRHSLTIFQSFNVAPQELAVESLPNNLIVIHTTPQPVEVVERTDNLRFRGLAQPGNVNICAAGSMAVCRWSEAISFISLNVSSSLSAVMPNVDFKAKQRHDGRQHPVTLAIDGNQSQIKPADFHTQKAGARCATQRCQISVGWVRRFAAGH